MDMKKIQLILVIFLLGSIVSQAQLGTTTIGVRVIGNDKLTTTTIGDAATPKCLFPGTCNGGCPVYTFVGSGNWDIPGNWSENVVPPLILPKCYEIVINPVGGECLLNHSLQNLSEGSKLTVMPGKKLRVTGLLAKEPG